MTNTLRKFQYILEGIDQEQLTDILVKRLKSRYPDISTKYEEDVLHDAAMDVASFHAGAEELGTSDIGSMIREVIKNLERFNQRGQGEKMIPNSVRGWRINEETEPERVVRQLKTAKKYLGQDPEPKEPEEKETNESYWGGPSPAQLRFNRALKKQQNSPENKADREKFQKEIDRIMGPRPVQPKDEPEDKEITEAFDQPYPYEWDKPDPRSYHALAFLDDGSPLDIEFNRQGNNEWHVKFDRNYSYKVTGEGNQQRVFATVIAAMKEFVKKRKPQKVVFSATKTVAPGQKSTSRSSLYSSLISRFATALGYTAHIADQDDHVVYELMRVQKPVTESSGTTAAGYTWRFEPGREVPMKSDVDANTFIRVKDPTGKTVCGVWADVEGDSIEIEYSQVFDERLRGRGVYTDLLRSLSKQYTVISDTDDNNAAAGIYRRLGADYDHRQATHTLRKQGVAEGFFDQFRKKQQNYGGIDVSVEKEDNNILVKATANGRELGRVLFTPSEQDDNLLVPLDLEVDERYRGQGIGATMYDYVKSLGYTIRRSQYQTDAGAGFWDKHKSGKNVWEQGVAEGSEHEGLVLQFLKSITPKELRYYSIRDNCGPAALHMMDWAKEKGIELHRVNGYFVADNVVYDKADFTKEMKHEFLQQGLDFNDPNSRQEFIASNPKYSKEWKKVPHYWLQDDQGTVYDPTGYIQFIKTGLAKDLDKSRYETVQGVAEGVAEGSDQDIPSVLYHATYKPRLKSIKLKGLGAGGKRNWEDSQRGVVYLALDPNVAESYAETSDMVPEEWLDQIVILKISTAGLDPNKFGIDSNVQDNSGDTVEYHGVIPVSNISLYKQGLAEGRKKKKKKTSRSLGRYFFPGYSYYGSGESGEGGGGEGVAEGLNEFAPDGFNGGDDSNDLQLYLNVAKKLNMKKYKPSIAHDLIAKKMAELVDVVDDDKVDYARHMARKAQGLPNMLEQGVAEGVAKAKLEEIGFASALDDSTFSTDSLLKIGKVIGQVENNDVMMASAGSEVVYFLVVNNEITSFIGLNKGYLKNIKNFTKSSGVVRALLGYLIHIEGKKIKISADEPLTADGIKWITYLIKSPRGLQIIDTFGKPVDPIALKKEWELSKKSGNSGPTGIVISENQIFGNKLRDNEERRKQRSLLMPFNMYEMPNCSNQGVAEGEHAPSSLKTMVDVGGIQLNVAIDGAEVSIRPVVDGYQAGYVVFDRDGRTLVPDDLAIDDEFRGRGIAKIIYDYVKSLGFTIRRSSDQTRAGKHFWDKNRGEDSQVWEQTMTAKELDEACWKGYHKEGMKTMFGKRYPNCVKNTKEDIEENHRIARKPGQPAKSKAHSDLYTDEDPKGTIHGLKFATVDDAHASVAKIKSSGRSHAQTDAGRGLWQDKQVWEQLNESKTTLNNIYDGDYPDEDELIWNFVGNQDFDVPFTVKTLSADTLKHMLLDTYGVDELKDLFRKMQPDQKATIEYYKDDPSLSNHIIIVNKNIIVDGNHRALAAVLANKNIKCVDISEEPINEKKDACYYKVKSRYKVWPSAYASGALVQCRKKGASNWGTKSESSILEGIEQTDENLHKWFKEKWVRFGPDGKIRGACARGDDSEGKPKCLPQSKAQNLGKKGRASAASRKRREDPNPERSGKAINVATKKKTTESSILQGISETKGLPMPGSYEQENKPFLRKGGQKLMALTTEQEELDEKWSDKYKRSIDCSHPKGFSQRAHCQGRKKK